MWNLRRKPDQQCVWSLVQHLGPTLQMAKKDRNALSSVKWDTHKFLFPISILVLVLLLWFPILLFLGSSKWSWTSRVLIHIGKLLRFLEFGVQIDTCSGRSPQQRCLTWVGKCIPKGSVAVSQLVSHNQHRSASNLVHSQATPSQSRPCVWPKEGNSKHKPKYSSQEERKQLVAPVEYQRAPNAVTFYRLHQPQS